MDWLMKWHRIHETWILRYNQPKLISLHNMRHACKREMFYFWFSDIFGARLHLLFPRWAEKSLFLFQLSSSCHYSHSPQKQFFSAVLFLVFLDWSVLMLNPLNWNCSDVSFCCRISSWPPQTDLWSLWVVEGLTFLLLSLWVVGDTDLWPLVFVSGGGVFSFDMISFCLQRHRGGTGRLPSTGSSSEVIEDDLSSVLYIHSYVCLLSKIVLHWFNAILFTGYRKSLTLEDLGKIPLVWTSSPICFHRGGWWCCWVWEWWWGGGA